jgi:hypothetical protein
VTNKGLKGLDFVRRYGEELDEIILSELCQGLAKLLVSFHFCFPRFFMKK